MVNLLFLPSMMNLPGVTAEPALRRDQVGRPTDYRPEYADQALHLCEMGATDQQLADFFDVSLRTIQNWRIANEPFAIASRVGKKHADEEVKRSAFMLSRGYYVKEQQAIKVKDGPHSERVEVVEVDKYVPPNAMLQAKWMAVRGDKEFAETQRVEHSGEIKTNKIDLSKLDDTQLSAYMAFMEAMKPKDEKE